MSKKKINKPLHRPKKPKPPIVKEPIVAAAVEASPLMISTLGIPVAADKPYGYYEIPPESLPTLLPEPKKSFWKRIWSWF